VEEDERYRYYISAAYLSDGKILHIHRKVYLPHMDFRRKALFRHRKQFPRFRDEICHAGILICEDFWHASSPYTLWLDGADLMLFISASPGRGVTEETLGSAHG